MFIEHGASEIFIRPIEHFARAHHGLREQGALVGRKAAKENSHGKSGGLCIGDALIGLSRDEKIYLLRAQTLAITQMANNLLR